MKVGEYCRTDKGKIGKIVHFEPRDKYPYSYDRVILDTEGYKRTTRNIIKCSEEIKDLIEVGDLVYVDISPDDCGGIIVPRIAETERELNSLKLLIENKDYILKSIITHEQIENMEYKVKE